jgi:hypothetical protein
MSAIRRQDVIFVQHPSAIPALFGSFWHIYPRFCSLFGLKLAPPIQGAEARTLQNRVQSEFFSKL